MFYKDATVQTFINETEAPLQSMNTRILSDGSVWGRIYWLDCYKEQLFFANETEALFYSGTNRFSRMKYLDKFGSSQVLLKNLAPKINGANGFSAGASNDPTVEGLKKYGDTSLMLTGNSGQSETTSQSQAVIPLINGHTYYTRVEVKQPTVVGRAQIYLGGTTVGSITEPSFTATSTLSPANTWHICSGVNTRTFPNGFHRLRLDFDNSGTAGTMYFDGLMVIDLTAAFGAGREPNKAWCDANIPYFEKEKIVDCSSLNFKKWEFLLTYPRLITEEFTELEYVYSSGTQYIDLGIYTTHNTKIVIDCEYSGPYSIYGSGQGWTNFTANSVGGYFYRGGYDQGATTPKNWSYGRRQLMQDRDKCYIDGDLIHVFPNTYFSSPGTLFLFGRNNNSGGLNDAGGKVVIYKCKIYEDDELVRDLVPCKNKSGQVGLLDKKHNKFYTSLGSGALGAGPVTKASYKPFLYNRWSQTDNHQVSSPGGYVPISCTWATHMGPLRRYVSADRIWDCDNGVFGPAAQVGNWFNPIGQLRGWTNNSIPGASGTETHEIELWVRLDTLNPIQKMQIYNDEILGPEFYEF